MSPFKIKKKRKTSNEDDTAFVSSREDLLVISDESIEYDTMWILNSACSHYYTSY